MREHFNKTKDKYHVMSVLLVHMQIKQALRDAFHAIQVHFSHSLILPLVLTVQQDYFSLILVEMNACSVPKVDIVILLRR